MKAPRAIDSFSEIATARIELKDTDPPIWREVEVPTSITLKVLHDIVQATIGWMDYHLWQLVIDGRTYGLPDDEDWGTAPRKEAAKVRLRDVLKPGETVITYTYDFGDDRVHEIRIRDIRQGEPGVGYPRYIADEHNGPPEDCGGVPATTPSKPAPIPSMMNTRPRHLARRLRPGHLRPAADQVRPRPDRRPTQRRQSSHRKVKDLSPRPSPAFSYP